MFSRLTRLAELSIEIPFKFTVSAFSHSLFTQSCDVIEKHSWLEVGERVSQCLSSIFRESCEFIKIPSPSHTQRCLCCAAFCFCCKHQSKAKLREERKVFLLKHNCNCCHSHVRRRVYQKRYTRRMSAMEIERHAKKNRKNITDVLSVSGALSLLSFTCSMLFFCATNTQR